MRFSKQTLADYIALRIRNIEQEHQFDPTNGTAQLHIPLTTVVKAEAHYKRCVAYGAWRALESIAEEFTLPVGKEVA